LQILAEILRIARAGARKTRIMYQANLSFAMLNKYLGYALETELVACPDGECYVATSKGREFMEKYDKYVLRSSQVEDQMQAMAREKAMLEQGYMAKQRRSGSSTVRNASRK
jgi:predicted transcriptional regulator